ncbi:MAG: dockerin type I domain-containing protein [Planctomycetota bacterium]
MLPSSHPIIIVLFCILSGLLAHTVSAQSNINNGEELTGSIVAGEQSQFSFLAKTPGIILISVGETGAGRPAEPVIEIRDSNGIQLAIDSSTDSASIQFQIPADDYLIVVRDGLNDEPLEFRIRVAFFPGSPTLVASRDQALKNGPEFVTSVPLGTFAIFPVAVDQSGTIRISIGETGAGLPAEPTIQLFFADGTLVANESGIDSASVSYFATEPGTYYAVIRDNRNDEPIQFRLRSVQLPGTPDLIAGRDLAEFNGQEFETSIPMGSFAVILLSIQSEGKILFYVGETTMGLSAEPQIQLFNGSGELVASNVGSNNAFIEFNANQAGQYTVLIGDNFNDEPIQTRARCLSIPGKYNLIAERDISLSNGDEVHSFVPKGTFSIFPFELENEGRLLLTLGETAKGTPAEPAMMIVNSKGLTLANSAGENSAELEISNIDAGTYVLIVTDDLSDEPLEFSARILTLPGNPNLDNEKDAALTCGNTHSSISPRGSFALFPVEVNEIGCKQIRINEISDSMSAEPRLSLFNFAGELIGTAINDDEVKIEYDFENSGTYYAVVRDNRNDEELEFDILIGNILTGDLNSDGVVTLLDVAPFVTLLNSGEFQVEGDINKDGIVNLLDVQPFVEILGG